MRRFAALLLVCLLVPGVLPAGAASFGSFSAEESAEVLDLGSRVVGAGEYPAFIEFLRCFPDLKKVDMFATHITADKVALLEEAFPDVEFGWSLQMMRYHIIRTDAEAWSTLHGKHPNHSSEEFALLKYCRNLLALDLGHNNLTDISFLRSMPRLRVLILGENQRLRDITEIGSLRNLEYLELFTCGITDISPLVNLTRLMDLNLANNRVQDWRPLMQMPWLKRLWISGMCASSMTAAERQELQEALPDTEIMFKGQPTDYGWRTDPKTKAYHPHYRVIYDMFRQGVYIPFAESAPLSGEEPADPFLITEDVEEEEFLNGAP